MSPIAKADGHDVPRLLDELVPSGVALAQLLRDDIAPTYRKDQPAASSALSSTAILRGNQFIQRKRLRRSVQRRHPSVQRQQRSVQR